MKKVIAILLCSCLLCGCSSKNNYLQNNDFILSDTNVTTKNISIGSNSDDFIEAYKNYITYVVYWDNNNNNKSIKINIEDIDYSKQCTIYISSLCIDNKIVDGDNFIKQNKIKNGIDNWFSENTDYLDNHTAIYKCLIFTFENGNVYDIESYEKNYNDETT